jgi:hypothetical protein
METDDIFSLDIDNVCRLTRAALDTVELGHG